MVNIIKEELSLEELLQDIRVKKYNTIVVLK